MVLTGFYQQVSRLATRKGIILLFVAAHVVLGMMMLFTFPRINAQLGGQAFDLRTFGYTHEEAVQMIGHLDEATTDFYLFPQIFLLDILYPVLLALFLSTLIIRLTKLIHPGMQSPLSWLYILPFAAMDFDYLENILIALMISGKASVTEPIVYLANTSTLLKGLLTTASWLAIIILFFYWWFNRKNIRSEEGIATSHKTTS